MMKIKKSKKRPEGRIITFYSFKGGVGRTMALANVAFLAARNGQRVLMMDWDLEAPGLGYYFRGLLDAPEARALKDAPGVLDIMLEWAWGVKACQSQAEFDALLKRFQTGEPFQTRVRPLLAQKHLPKGGTLDFIGAGSRNPLNPDPMPYEAALADFSWAQFFADAVGGQALFNLRNWAKSQYDIILLDSRTGLADVAGICTMQMPDEVALCFVLNHQNIDGVAKVAAAIRAHRQDEIKIRAVPMRITGTGTFEGSDAHARALGELKRVGGFSAEAVQNDFNGLSVRSADNVPFYETLAPFAASDEPEFDRLTLNYLQLASELIGKPFKHVPIESEWVGLVKRRLQPRQVTVEYLAKLQSADPYRIVAELQRLVEAAIDDKRDGIELDDDYVRAIVEMIGDGNIYLVDAVDVRHLQRRTLDLLRRLVEEQASQWQPLLILAIEGYLMCFIGTEDELPMLQELDGLLVQLPSMSFAERLKRINYRIRAARLFIDQAKPEAALQKLDGIRTVLNNVHDEDLDATGTRDNVIFTEAEIALLTGDAYHLKGDFFSAYKEYGQGLEQLADIKQAKKHYLTAHYEYLLHSRFAEAEPPFVPEEVAAEHAVMALKSGGSRISLSHLVQLAKPILKVPDPPYFALDFCESFLVSPKGFQSLLHNIQVGRIEVVIDFFITILGLCNIIATIDIDDERGQMALILVTETLRALFKHFNTKREQFTGNQKAELAHTALAILTILKNAAIPAERLAELEHEVSTFAPSLSSNPPAP